MDFDFAPDADELPEDHPFPLSSSLVPLGDLPGNSFSGKQNDIAFNDTQFIEGDTARSGKKAQKANASKKRVKTPRSDQQPLKYQGPWAPFEDESFEPTGLDNETYQEILDDRMKFMRPDNLYRWKRLQELKEKEAAEKKAISGATETFVSSTGPKTSAALLDDDEEEALDEEVEEPEPAPSSPVENEGAQKRGATPDDDDAKPVAPPAVSPSDPPRIEEEKPPEMIKVIREDSITDEIKTEFTTYHSRQPLYDYQGRSYVKPPSYRKPIDFEQCVSHLPKKKIHDFIGHIGAVSHVRFFPTYGHLLASAGLADGTIKIWDCVNRNRNCIRTLHTLPARPKEVHGIRDFTWNLDGTRIYTASFDGFMREWDTETGTCLARYATGIVPLTVKQAPNHPHLFLVGQKDRMIIEWDVREAKVEQKYDGHLKAVNTITFLEGGKRFVTTSDDNSLRVWDLNIPVPTKTIAESDTKAFSSVTMHPSGDFFLCNSLDNQICTFEARTKIRRLQKKSFTGHISAGYTIDVDCSPDGQFVVSGESNGNMVFWKFDSPTMKPIRLKAHDKVCSGVAWNPIDQSQVASCGYDGIVRYWD
ncbi:putative Pre-mRNA-processing factor 17 [Blattamonas nauphoetae]|uniref:Pre-mRNA-processing factor 17 n=1 Tax=Blattamonas nauphoetae TaxID=2049346 RepID=A0ABQ9XFB6_9EUKA|nr:putative Pre-mRNA-processing factor 17 [Blattamonas nauphoetae]